MKIEEMNCVTFALTHFGIALKGLTDLRELVDTKPEASNLERYGYLFQVVFQLQEGNNEIYTFLDSNHYTELEQMFKAELYLLSGTIDGYLTWMADEFIPNIMKDEVWEKLQYRNLEAFDDGKKGIFRIEETLKRINQTLETLHNIRDCD